MDNNLNSSYFKIDEFLSYIENADDIEINQILDSITRRYSHYYPDWDIAFLSLPKAPAQRKPQVRLMLEKLEADTLE